MATALDRDIRRLLDKAVRKARTVAEDGARKALTELGVEDAKRPTGLSPAQAELRNRLRAHARSLGDAKAADDSIKAHRLVREIAYEHWHRALFARFLAENNLLIEPQSRQPVSLSDLDEIAKEEARDPVELAAYWAEPMLPQIFRKDDPVLALALPPETKAGITDIVKDLPRAVFAADDSLGWVYQFWQADQKERVNESEVKIGADELPAVTQLFTEDYMVLFLLENTLGAWWAGKVLAADPSLAAGAASEEELREKTSSPGYRWTYLRFVREQRDGETHETATGAWRPAAGTFEGWPKAAKEITVLDPCMGSGHFLVFALPILVAFRRAEEVLDERAAVKAVLADNLFGLEIDPRCTQIAAFALALASWKRLGGPEPLPRLNLACSGLAIGAAKQEFLGLAERIAGRRGWKPTVDLLGEGATPIETAAIQQEREGLSRLYDLFSKAPHLGSLIDPAIASGDLFAAGYARLATLLIDVLEAGEASIEIRELAVVAQGLAKAAELLSRRYALVSTNVPYLGLGKQGPELRDFLRDHYSDAKADLATAFLERLRAFVNPTGEVAAVLPQSWLFLGTYSRLRSRLLKTASIDSIARLGPGAFETITGEVVNTCLIAISQQSPQEDHTVFGIDVAQLATAEAKGEGLKISSGNSVKQASQLTNADFRIVIEPISVGELLLTRADSFEGIGSGDLERFSRSFSEVESFGDAWRPFRGTVKAPNSSSGMEAIILWQQGRGDLFELARLLKEHLKNTGGPSSGARPTRGSQAWERHGIAVNRMGNFDVDFYFGEVFDSNIAAVIPKSKDDCPAIWAFMSSGEFREAVRKIDQSMKVTNVTFLKVPFDRSHWQKVASEKYPNGLPKPHSNDPTQWLFDGHPHGSADPNVPANDSTNLRLVAAHGVRPGLAEHPLQVAVARLVGYRWPRQTGSSFMDCPAIAEHDEIDTSGLVDADGIVALPALAGEADAASRLRELIRTVWGADYTEHTIRELLAAEDAKSTDLGAWLADEFFDGHCRLFHQTPFVWHVWDGLRGGFSALVNYHRLCEPDGAGRRLLEKLRDSYLGEWIAAQRRAVAAGETGAEDRLIAAEHLRAELTKIIEGEPPYDIFVRWKPLHRQPIGWEPDIDDGVRLNIRPFLTAKPKNSSRKDACILRVTPGAAKKFAKPDRGAEPHRDKEDYPWFWSDDDDVATENFAGGPAFKGRRYNDFHYTRAFKQRARDSRSRKP
ncbi:MAG: N-6 DNA methylase [Alphaproteobacteria bacterium]|nr:N-6 DNA methylase [Alphaproteobacteria bacterium]